MNHGKILRRAKQALRDAVAAATDSRGYVATPEENLITGVGMTQFESDFRKGAGKELDGKFRAAHSSSALVVNSFAPFVGRPAQLRLLGCPARLAPSFEKQLRVVPSRRPAHLDLWVECEGNRVLAVESKLLEYITPKRAKFAPTYADVVKRFAEPAWEEAYLQATAGGLAQLDRAQLIKHYLGIRRHQSETGSTASVTLLYLFWEPTNWEEIALFPAHRQEVESFAQLVSGGAVAFSWMTYQDLWAQWASHEELKPHLARLRRRYAVGI